MNGMHGLEIIPNPCRLILGYHSVSGFRNHDAFIAQEIPGKMKRYKEISLTAHFLRKHYSESKNNGGWGNSEPGTRNSEPN